MTKAVTSPVSPRWDPWLPGLLGLGLLLRAAYLVTPALDSDRAVVGLMARHILQGEFPIFFWGQAYGGTLEAHLAALLFFLFSPSRLTLSLSPLLFSVAFLLLTYRLAREAFGPRAGRLALLLVAVPPSVLASHGVTTWGHYISHLTLGSLILLLALRFVRAAEPSPRACALLGGFAGLAWYNNPQSVHYLVAAGLLLLVRRPQHLLAPAVWPALPAFLLGSAPFWIYNLTTPTESTLSAILGRGRLDGVGDSLVRYVVEKIPEILGVTGEGRGVARALDFLLVGLYVLAFGYLLARVRHDGSQTVLLLMVVTSAIVVLGYNRGGATRYLLPLYSVLPVAMAAFLQALRGRSTPAFAVALGGLLAGSLAANAAEIDVVDREKLALYQGRLARDARLFDFLRADGLTRVYVFDFWDAYRLTFDAAETIVFAEPVPSYYPPYTGMVDAAPRYAYVIRRSHEAAIFEANLGRLGGGYRRRDVAGFAVFDALEAPPRASLRKLSPGDWHATASHGAADAHLAFDRNPGTAWSTGTPQRPGVYYELDLGQVRRIGKVVLAAGATATAAPRGFRIETSSDRARWTTAHSLASAWPGLAWKGARLRADASGGIGVRFPPVAARWIRITLLRDGHAQWAIQELFVSEEDAPPSPGGRTVADDIRPAAPRGAG